MGRAANGEEGNSQAAVATGSNRGPGSRKQFRHSFGEAIGAAVIANDALWPVATQWRHGALPSNRGG